MYLLIAKTTNTWAENENARSIDYNFAFCKNVKSVRTSDAEKMALLCLKGVRISPNNSVSFSTFFTSQTVSNLTVLCENIKLYTLRKLHRIFSVYLVCVSAGMMTSQWKETPQNSFEEERS